MVVQVKESRFFCICLFTLEKAEIFNPLPVDKSCDTILCLRCPSLIKLFLKKASTYTQPRMFSCYPLRHGTENSNADPKRFRQNVKQTLFDSFFADRIQRKVRSSKLVAQMEEKSISL